MKVEDIDVIEVECIVANLIYMVSQERIKTIPHTHKKTITTTWLVIIFILVETDMGPR